MSCERALERGTDEGGRTSGFDADMTTFVRGKEGKRRKLEQPVLIAVADDALRKAGVTAGLRAGEDDERRVLLFQNAAKVAARIENRHRLPDWPNETSGERDSKIAKASEDMATLCSGPFGLRLALKRSPYHPMERFMEFVNACLVPLVAQWDRGYAKDQQGYKLVKLHDMLASPWVGEHTVDVPSQWNDFWQEVERQKLYVMQLAKEEPAC